jgi:hypothetical protein
VAGAAADAILDLAADELIAEAMQPDPISKIRRPA